MWHWHNLKVMFFCVERDVVRMRLVGEKTEDNSVDSVASGADEREESEENEFHSAHDSELSVEPAECNVLSPLQALRGRCVTGLWCTLRWPESRIHASDMIS